MPQPPFFYQMIKFDNPKEEDNSVVFVDRHGFFGRFLKLDENSPIPNGFFIQNNVNWLLLEGEALMEYTNRQTNEKEMRRLTAPVTLEIPICTPFRLEPCGPCLIIETAFAKPERIIA